MSDDRAIVLLVDDDGVALAATEGELRKRYGADYEVVAFTSTEDALAALRDVQHHGRPVALVLADLWMPSMTGIEFLDLADDLYPTAKRALLVGWQDRSARQPILEALAMGRIDCHLPRPASAPDEAFHQVVTELLWESTKSHAARPARIKVVGDQSSPRCHEIRDLLERHSIPFRFYGSDTAEGRTLLAEAGGEGSSVPVFVLENGRVLTDPTNMEAADALGGGADLADNTFDVAVVGAGPAGLAASVYATSEGLRTLVIEGEAIGGQAGTTSRIRNYLGFPRGISGSDLAARAHEQALHFGAVFHVMREAVQLRPGVPYHELTLSDGQEVRARAVVVATGVSYRRLGVPSLEGLVGRGVFYGPAVSEARAVASLPVFIVGGGNSAGQAAVHLARYASQVTILVRGDSLAASMSDYLVREIQATRNIAVRFRTQAVAGTGDHQLERLVLRDDVRGTTETVAARGLFMLIGGEPRTDWLPRQIVRCPRDYLMTGPDLPGGQPLVLETSVPGVFAAGDVRHRSIKRVASAAGEGAMVVAMVHEHLARSSTQLATAQG